MIDYSRINGAHCVLIGTERQPCGVRTTWMLWSNGESTWGDFIHERIPAPEGFVVYASHALDSGHAPIPEHVTVAPPTMPIVANGPLPPS